MKQTPLLLEINTHSSKLRDFIEKIVKSKLGMNCPLIMLGSTLIYEVGDDLEEDVAASYNQNLDKVRNFSLWTILCSDVSLYHSKIDTSKIAGVG